MGKKTKQTEETPTRSEEMLRALHTAAAAIQRAARSPDAVLEAVGRELGRLRLYGAVILLDESRENLVLRYVILDRLALAAIKKLIHIDPVGLAFPRVRVDVYRQVLETGQAVFTPHTVEIAAQILPEPLSALAEPVVQATGYREGIVAPLTLAGERIGILAVAATTLTPAAVPAITAFADQLSAALENAQLYEQLARREQETAAISVIVRALNANLSVKDVFGAVARELGKLAPFDRASIALLSADQQSFTMYVLASDRPNAPLGAGVTMPLSATACEADVLAGRPHLTPDLGAEADYPAERLLYEAGLRSRVNVPLRVGERVLGALNLASTRPAAFSEHHLGLLQQVAGAIAAALQNAQLYEQVQESETRYRHLVENTHDLIYEVDAEGMFTYCSPSVEFLGGYTPDEVVGRHFMEFIHPDDLPVVLETVQRRMKGVLGPAEYRVRTKDGRVVWARGFSRPVVRDGQVVGLAGVAMDITERKQAEIALQDRNEQLVALNQIGQAITASLDPQRILETIASQATALLGADAVGIYEWASDGDTLVVNVAHGLRPEYLEIIRARRERKDQGAIGQAIARHTPVHISDVRIEPGYEFTEIVTAEGYVGVTGAGIFSGGQAGLQPVGAICLWWRRVETISQENLTLLQTLADQAAIALENARLYAESQRRLRELDSLLASARHVTSTLDLDEVLQRVVESAIAAIGPAEKGSLHLFDEAQSELVMRASVGFSPQTIAAVHLRPDEGYTGWAFAHRQPIIVGDVQADPRTKRVDLPEVQELKSALCVPLVVRDRVIGTLSLDNVTRYNAFTTEHRDLLTIFASQVAGAIESARLFQETRHRAETLAALHETALDLATQRALPDLMQAIVARATDLLAANSGAILLYRPETDDLQVAAEYRADVDRLGVVLPRGEGLAGRVLETGQPVAVDDYSHWPGRSMQPPMLHADALAGVPIRWGDRFLGVLSVGDRAPRTFSPADIALLEQFTPLAAAALEQARLLHEARRRATELGILYDVTTAATTSVHLEQVLNHTIDTLRQALEPDNLSIQLVEPKTGDLVVQAAAGFSDGAPLVGRRVAAGAGIIGWVTQTGQPALVPDVRQDDRYHPYDLATRSELCVPLCVRSRTIGALDLESHQVGAFSESDLHLVSTLAGHLATVIDHARLVQTLRESEARYRTLFEQANDAVHLETLDGRILDANAKACEMRGYSREELLTLTVADLVSPELRWQVPQAIEALLRTGVFRTESEDLCKDGTRIPVEVSSSLLRLDGQNLVMTVVRDIGERKRLEEQLRQAQKMEAIGTLAGGIAHDFNNLLGGILGFASLLERDLPADSPLRTPVDTIIRTARRGAELTNQLLAFARGGRYEVRPADLNDIAREVVRLLSRTVDKAIAIEPRLAADLAAVEGDAGQLHQMLLNLCLNAVDAMPAGGQLVIETANVTLSEADVRAELDLNPGPYVWLRVTDTGIGMDPETLRRIFEPFFTTKKGLPGRPHSGLGLSMVYGIVRSHGGAIRVHSELGRGSTFEVYLPAIARPMVAPAAPPAPVLGGTETVLVVDDEEFIVHLLREVLPAAGYTVLVAQDGVEAVELYRQHAHEIDLVLLDMGLPRLSGRDVFRQLCEIDPQVAVLISSGYAEDDQARVMLAAGARGFLAKPYDVNEVLRKIRQALR